MNQIKIENVEFEKDIGVIFDNELEFDRHITEKTNKAHSIYGMLRRTFKQTPDRGIQPLLDLEIELAQISEKFRNNPKTTLILGDDFNAGGINPCTTVCNFR